MVIIMELFFLCLKVFVVRIIDVSLGTFRTMQMVKGKAIFATLIGFFEILIWFLVVKEAINTDSNSIFIALSYAGGFATGTYLGMFIADKYIEELLSIQIITTDYKNLSDALTKAGFGITEIEVLSKDKQKRHMIFLSINSYSYNKFNKILKEVSPKSFMVINESKYTRNGYFLNNNK